MCARVYEIVILYWLSNKHIVILCVYSQVLCSMDLSDLDLLDPALANPSSGQFFGKSGTG